MHPKKQAIPPCSWTHQCQNQQRKTGTKSKIILKKGIMMGFLQSAFLLKVKTHNKFPGKATWHPGQYTIPLEGITIQFINVFTPLVTIRTPDRFFWKQTYTILKTVNCYGQRKRKQLIHHHLKVSQMNLYRLL